MSDDDFDPSTDPDEKPTPLPMIGYGVAIEIAARNAHEANRAYCAALGDRSQPAWEVASEEQRDSCFVGVKGVLMGNGPEESHLSWLAEKRKNGWKYAPLKDVEMREHPCMVPYGELPASQRMKDAVFVATVRAVTAALGWGPTGKKT
jgi:hypothetical protein